MTAITSYLRHLIVTFVIFCVEKFQLPIEGSEDAAHALAILIIGTITWAIVKYLPNIAKKMGLMTITLATFMILSSCEVMTGSISYTDTNSGAKAGIGFRGKDKPTGFIHVPIYDEKGKLIHANLILVEPSK